MRNKFGITLMSIGLLMIAAALGLLLHNNFENRRAKLEAGSVLEAIQEDLYEKRAENETIPVITDEPEVTEEDLQKEMPVMEINGYDYIGYLSIPSIHLELPVMSEWDYPRMKISPCRHYGSIYTNDLVIAGHNNSSHFGSLPNLSIGDSVFFTDMDGICRTYAVMESEILEPDQIKEMKESPWDLTLYTCTVGGARRFTIRCALIQ